MDIKKFRTLVRRRYRTLKRGLPWRKTADPYRILVSEVMLQQTQVSRAAEKYRPFLKAFPTVRALAKAPLPSVLAAWQGLGYNRRALMLKRAAEIIVTDYAGKVPRDPELLARLPGIGRNTAGAICVYAYGLPVPFIETNIRRVFIHHFFPGRRDVSDVEILPLAAAAAPRKNLREWYWALMDYGSHLPKIVSNPNRNSKHYVRQSKFEGSTRQLRGKIIRLLLERGPVAAGTMESMLNDGRTRLVIEELRKDGLLEIWQGKIALAK